MRFSQKIADRWDAIYRNVASPVREGFDDTALQEKEKKEGFDVAVNGGNQREGASDRLLPGQQFEIVKDYKQRETYEEKKGQHELLGEAMGALVHKIKEGKYDGLVFLDKSARPLVTMLAHMWPYAFNAEGRMTGEEKTNDALPPVNFLHVGSETGHKFSEYFSRHPEALQERAQEAQAKAIDAYKNVRKSQGDRNATTRYKWAARSWTDVASRVRERGFFGAVSPGDSFSLLLELITPEMVKDIFGDGELEKIADTYAALQNRQGKILIVDEYAISGQSMRLAKKIIESAIALRQTPQGAMPQVETYSLSRDNDELFLEEDGHGSNPPWRNPLEDIKKGLPEDAGMTGVVSSEGLTAKAANRETPNAAGRVSQLRRELHTIAETYLTNERKRLDAERLSDVRKKIGSAN